MNAQLAQLPRRSTPRREPLPPPPGHRGRAMVEALIAELIARAAVTTIVASERLRRVLDERPTDCLGRGRC